MLARNPNASQAPATMTTSPETTAMTFAQRGSVGGIDGITHNGITCYICQLVGHYATQCPTEGASHSLSITGATLIQYAFVMAQANPAPEGIDPTGILLNSQSTISVFNNRSMLKNVCSSSHVLRAFTNGGFQDSDMIGEFPNLGNV